MAKLIKISRILQTHAQKINNSENESHSHNYEELLVGLEGRLEHFIDFNKSTIDAPFICFISKGKVHQLKPQLKNKKCDIWVIRFKSEFMPEHVFQLYADFHNNASLSLPKDDSFKRFASICEIINDEAKQVSPDYSTIRHLLSALFSKFKTKHKEMIGNDDLQYTKNTTFINFLKILEDNFRRPVSIEFYAEKLFMSSRNLNLICQNILQQSVSEIIEIRKLTEAKNLLVTKDMSISEIGFELGYKEKAYFSNVFKKKIGLSPSEFRSEMKKHFS